MISYQRNRRLVEEFEDYWHLLEREGLPSEWRRIVRHFGPGAAAFFLPFAPMWRTPQMEGAAQASTLELDYYLSHPDEYMPPSHELVIQKIEMASPGSFSLRGLGEPLRELRELIKDFWYRNRQEREHGELEIMQQKIAVLSRANLPPQQVLVLAV